MQPARLPIPRPLSLLISRLPAFPPSFAFTTILNLALGRIIREGNLQPLQGKNISIRVTDVGLHLHFTMNGGGFEPIHEVDQSDLTFSATAYDFYLLASRQEDPDSLFFSRRLLIEGDTALGLVAKNTLDSLDLPKFTPSMLLPGNVLAMVKSHLMGR
jgi:predicted lipid carrier protein YhbT